MPDRTLPPRPKWLTPAVYRRLCYLSVPCYAVGRDRTRFCNPALREEEHTLPAVPRGANRKACTLIPLTAETEPRYALGTRTAEAQYYFFPRSLTGMTASLAARRPLVASTAKAIVNGCLNGLYTDAASACRYLFSVSPIREQTASCQRFASVADLVFQTLFPCGTLTVIGDPQALLFHLEEAVQALGTSAMLLRREPSLTPVLQIEADRAFFVIGDRAVSLGRVRLPLFRRPSPFIFHRSDPVIVLLLALTIEFGETDFDGNTASNI